jgi:TetR/AcrR family transcriptional regulator, transcriptional repressor for nem operon
MYLWGMETRDTILKVSFNAVRERGFLNLRPDKEIADLGMTKGAYYHHFAGKLELGYAMLEELLRPAYLEPWNMLLRQDGSALDALMAHLAYMRDSRSEADVKSGCVLNNLIQEMSSVDAGFADRLESLVEDLHLAIKKLLQKAREQGDIKSDRKPGQIAWFILSSMEGAASMGKAMRSRKIYVKCMDILLATLETYRNTERVKHG